jgi:hypothetical protein
VTRARRRERFALLLILLAYLVGCVRKDTIEVSEAYLRPPVTGQTTAVGYFTIVNRGATAMVLKSASCAVASSIEIHTHVREGDMMRMRPLAEVAIAPDETVSFAPGGHHLMIFRYDNPSSVPVPITLGFGDGTSRTVTFEVRERTPGQP